MRVVVKNISKKGNHKLKGPEVKTMGVGGWDWNFGWKWCVFFLRKKFVFTKNNSRNSITT